MKLKSIKRSVRKLLRKDAEEFLAPVIELDEKLSPKLRARYRAYVSMVLIPALRSQIASEMDAAISSEFSRARHPVYKAPFDNDRCATSLVRAILAAGIPSYMVFEVFDCYALPEDLYNEYMAYCHGVQRRSMDEIPF